MQPRVPPRRAITLPPEGSKAGTLAEASPNPDPVRFPVSIRNLPSVYRRRQGVLPLHQSAGTLAPARIWARGANQSGSVRYASRAIRPVITPYWYPLVARPGFEPGTFRLRGGSSTTELAGRAAGPMHHYRASQTTGHCVWWWTMRSLTRESYHTIPASGGTSDPGAGSHLSCPRSSGGTTGPPSTGRRTPSSPGRSARPRPVQPALRRFGTCSPASPG